MSLELDDIGGARELAKRRLEVAKEDLSDAENTFKNDMYRASINRSYYAIYHAISACLALKFMAFKSHGQALANFNKEYIYGGVFPKEIGRKISKAQEVRHASDYDDFYVVSKEETFNQLEWAKEIVCIVKEYIESEIV